MAPSIRTPPSLTKIANSIPPPCRVAFQVRESTGNPKPLPLLVKIAPDLTEKEKKEIAGVVLATKARHESYLRELM